VAFGEYYADDQEDSEPHELEALKPRNIINYLDFFKHVLTYPVIIDSKLSGKKLFVQVHFFLNRTKITFECDREKIILKFCE
jgi:hypothetical protein